MEPAKREERYRRKRKERKKQANFEEEKIAENCNIGRFVDEGITSMYV